jgi:hypothetical protein
MQFPAGFQAGIMELPFELTCASNLARAALRKYNGLGSLNNKNLLLIAVKAGSLRPKI